MKSPPMKTQALATIYLDNAPIGLMGDPKPRVSKIIAASGKRPENLQVLRALSPTDLRGRPVQFDDIIDRTAEPTKPIYLTSKPSPPASETLGPSAGSASRRTPPPEQPEPEWDP
ncbi:MAG: hypothetical protein ACYC2H_05285 [Thermoplasmatota archaeon]